MVRVSCWILRLVLVFYLGCSTAYGIDVYTDEATFLGAVSIASTEDFEGFPQDESVGFGDVLIDEVSYAAVGTPRNWYVFESTSGNGLSQRLSSTFPQPSQLTFDGGLTQAFGFFVSAAPISISVHVVVTSRTGVEVEETFTDNTYLGFAAPEGISSVLVESVAGDGMMAIVAFDDVSRGEILFPPEPGDMNGDGAIDESDVNPFVLALTDRVAYESAYPWIDAEATGDVNDSGGFDLGDVKDFRDLLVMTPDPGDMNGDGAINDADVNPFVLALTDRAAYESAYPGIDADATGDVNGSGGFDLGDVKDFRALLGPPLATAGPSSGASVPEPGPATLVLALIGAGLNTRLFRSRPFALALNRNLHTEGGSRVSWNRRMM